MNYWQCIRTELENVETKLLTHYVIKRSSNRETKISSIESGHDLKDWRLSAVRFRS